MLELSNVSKSFGGKTVVESASLSVNAGEILCLTGPSGVGKTTLLEIMAGLVRPDAGAVKRSADAAFLFQDDVLIPWLTAEETVAYILPKTMTENEKKECAACWLKKFELEGGLYPAAMSGGMRRRLSMARTFAANRRLILLDEPFAFLDEERRLIVAKEMAACATAGCAMVLTGHTATPLEHSMFAEISLRFAGFASAPVSVRL